MVMHCLTFVNNYLGYLVGTIWGGCVPFKAGFGSELEPLIHLLNFNSNENQLLCSQLSQIKNHQNKFHG